MIKVVVGALFATFILVTQSLAAQRVALVIGIEKYQVLSKLSNPVSDAKAIAAVLRVNNFQVFEYSDTTRSDLLDALESFRNEASKAEVALIYYAGHGLEVGGRNTIAPADMEFSCEAKQTRRSVELDKFFEAIQNTPQQIVMLDACRNDPFPTCERGGGGGGFRGFERVNMSRNNRVLLVNSTLSGRLANDGPPGSHSPFAAALLARFKSDPTTPVRDLLDTVARDVALNTDGAQTPEVMTRGGAPDVCLALSKCGGSSAIPKAPEAPTGASGSGTSPAASCSTTDADLAYQDAIRKNTIEAYRDFLSRCPDDRRKETVLGLYGRIADEQLWQNVSKLDTLSGYLQYEAAFPAGSYIDLAKKREKELRTAALGPSTPPSTPPPPPAPAPRQITYYQSTDFDGDDLSGWLSGHSLETCGEACRIDSSCKAFTYNTQKKICMLKTGYSNPFSYRYAVSGVIGEAKVPMPAGSASASKGDGMTLQAGVDYQSGDYANRRNVSQQACQQMCANDGRCLAFSYVKQKSWCWLKSEVGGIQYNSDIISGKKN